MRYVSFSLINFHLHKHSLCSLFFVLFFSETEKLLTKQNGIFLNKSLIQSYFDFRSAFSNLIRIVKILLLRMFTDTIRADTCIIFEVGNSALF